MLFNSFVFLIFFLLVLAAFTALPMRARRPLLLVASYVFYGWWDWRFLGLMALSTTLDWAIGLLLDRVGGHRKALVAASVVANLSILGVFKYLGFFSRELGEALTALGLPAPPVIDLVLPVGLSFYTFQSMAYTIDVYRGDVRATRSLLDFALFVSFFPQLVAGPIERYKDLAPQLRELKGSTAAQRAMGLHLMVWGLFKKVVVADNLAVVVERVFDGPTPSGFLVLVGAWAFTWQIYCDFSGYSDMARGVAAFLGVDLSVNFRLPFFATSPRDLWRRWHISLSQWLRDYLYIPLGGSRGSRLRTQLNLLTTMVLGGLWHGANWTFIAWGAFHGLGLAIQRALPERPLPRAARPLAVLAMFQVTSLGFLIFRARSMGQVGDLLGSVAGGILPGAGEAATLGLCAALIALPLLVELAMHLAGDDLDLLLRLPAPAQLALTALLTAAIAFLGGTAGRAFIYFQF